MDPSDLETFVPTSQHDSYDFVNPTKSDLSGKYVLVSGASKGIGKAIAISYAKAGVSGIVILARSDLTTVSKEVLSAARAAGRSEPKIIAITTDVTDRASVESAAEKVSNELGHIDILINNAGYLEPWKPMHESDPDSWWKTFEVNVKGVYLMTRSFLPLVLKSAEKTIINISSNGGVVARPGASAYQATKQTVIRMTDHLTVDYGSQGLLVYSIHPGSVATELANGMPEKIHALLVDTPQLAGDVLVFLTREKRTWLNNRFVSVNWDMSEFLAKREEIEEKDLLKIRLRVK